MKFVYLAEKTPDAPKKTIILGYTFIDGKITEVSSEKHIKKFSGMEHIGIIKKDKLGKTFFFTEEAAQDTRGEVNNDEFLKELTPNATDEHINNLVLSKSYIDLEKYNKMIGLLNAEKKSKKGDLQVVIKKYLKEAIKKLKKSNGTD